MEDPQHVVYVGWVLDIAARNGVPVHAVTDETGAYTDRVIVDLGEGVTVTLIVPLPPADWETTARAHPARSA